MIPRPAILRALLEQIAVALLVVAACVSVYVIVADAVKTTAEGARR